MGNNYPLFNNVLITLAEAGVLNQFILIGSWCLHIYRTYFHNAPQIPLLRTVDIDFLIPRFPKTQTEVNVHQLLLNLGFEQQFSLGLGHVKYIHPQMEIEFLTPELGKGSSKPYIFKNLHLHAQQLRYLNLLQEHFIQVNYNGIDINVPEPAAFVLHKLLLSYKRSNSTKSQKDLRTAVMLGEYLIELSDERLKLKNIFKTLPAGWKNNILKSVKDTSQTLKSFLETNMR